MKKKKRMKKKKEEPKRKRKSVTMMDCFEEGQGREEEGRERNEE